MHLKQRRNLTRSTLALLPLVLGGLTGCGNGSSGSPTTTSLPTGTVTLNAATNKMVIIEASLLGGGGSMRVLGDPLWGRLVDVWATDPATNQPRQYFEDYLIGQDISSNGGCDVPATGDYCLERNPATGRETLTIPLVFGTPAYNLAFARLTTGLQAFLDKSLSPAELPPFTAMPRNSAMVLRLNDLVDPATVSSSTIQLDTGYPPLTPYEARIIPDPNHGDFVGGTFFSTRILIDMSVSQEEANVVGIPPNPLGLPEAITTTQPSVVLRIPTRISVQAVQFELLRNRTGGPLSFFGNGSTDPFSSTQDVVRAFRAGGKFSVTGDPHNGFLRDLDPPRVLGSQPVTMTAANLSVGEYVVDFTFAEATCGTTPAKGDLLILPLNVLRVVADGNPPSPTGLVSNMRCELISGFPSNVVTPLTGDFRTPWRSGLTVSANCFVRFTPEAGQLPNQLVSNSATIVVAFDEPMYPPSLNPWDGMVVQKSPPPSNALKSKVLAVSAANLDLQEINFSPLVPLDHVQGQNEPFTMQLSSLVTDLAGNPLAFPLPQTMFTLDDTNGTINTGSIGSTFSQKLEVGSMNGAVDDDLDLQPEYRGQFIHDVSRGEIRPRSLDRFSATADPSQPSVGAMLPPVVPFAPIGTVPPLSGYGSRVMTLWRYFDLGMSLLDEATFNVDVEGLAWSPVSNGLSLDNYPNFQMRLSHSLFLPDEAVGTAGPLGPNSGLSMTFDANVLDSTNDPLTVVHAQTEGYLIQPLEIFSAPTGLGTQLAPWPLNRNKAVADYTYYTYRDTSITALGAPFGCGADPAIVGVVDPVNANVGFYPSDMVPTIGLPLLMEFKTYANNASGTANLLNVVYADVLGAFGLGGVPSFRIHSTGGALPNNNQVLINPDQAVTAIGGLDILGNPTFATDSMFYIGQAEFVVRISRIHSIWFNAGNGSSWADPVMSPTESEQPGGTLISLAFRGAVMTQTGGQNNADNIDMYGEKTGGGFTPLFINQDDSWKTSLADITGAQYMQCRITMISNPESGVSPTLTALGFSHFN
jgi:hypothetical protein